MTALSTCGSVADVVTTIIEPEQSVAGSRPRRERHRVMRLCCAFATGLETPDHIKAAEDLGCARAWVYDSPALCADAWMTLARAA